MDERSNRDPRELSPRKKAFAQEILRRRREAKNEGWWRKHAWLATTAAAFSIGVAVISRLPDHYCIALLATAIFSGIKVASGASPMRCREHVEPFTYSATH